MEMLRKEASQREFSICHCLSLSPKDGLNNWDPCLLLPVCILSSLILDQPTLASRVLAFAQRQNCSTQN